MPTPMPVLFAYDWCFCAMRSSDILVRESWCICARTKHHIRLLSNATDIRTDVRHPLVGQEMTPKVGLVGTNQDLNAMDRPPFLELL